MAKLASASTEGILIVGYAHIRRSLNRSGARAVLKRRRRGWVRYAATIDGRIAGGIWAGPRCLCAGIKMGIARPPCGPAHGVTRVFDWTVRHVAAIWIATRRGLLRAGLQLKVTGG